MRSKFKKPISYTLIDVLEEMQEVYNFTDEDLGKLFVSGVLRPKGTLKEKGTPSGTIYLSKCQDSIFPERKNHIKRNFIRHLRKYFQYNIYEITISKKNKDSAVDYFSTINSSTDIPEIITSNPRGIEGQINRIFANKESNKNIFELITSKVKEGSDNYRKQVKKNTNFEQQYKIYAEYDKILSSLKTIT